MLCACAHTHMHTNTNTRIHKNTLSFWVCVSFKVEFWSCTNTNHLHFYCTIKQDALAFHRRAISLRRINCELSISSAKIHTKTIFLARGMHPQCGRCMHFSNSESCANRRTECALKTQSDIHFTKVFQSQSFLSSGPCAQRTTQHL